MSEFTHLGLFEGIGGFSLAARWMGWKTVAWCEINPFCQLILKQHFPEAEGIEDITKKDFTKYANRINLLTGGFPCQSFSLAGKGAVDLTLWKEMFRAIREIKPQWVVAENVPGIIGRKLAMAFETVCSDLESEGYTVQAFSIPIAGKGAPHKRERIWFIAHSNSFGCDNEQKENAELICDEKRDYPIKEQSGDFEQCRVMQSNFNPSDLHSERLPIGFREQQRSISKPAQTQQRVQLSGIFAENEQWGKEWPEIAAEFCGVDDGVPNRVDRIKACGNALSPYVALELFKTINQYRSLK